MSQVGTCLGQTIRCTEEPTKYFILATCSWDKSQYFLNKLYPVPMRQLTKCLNQEVTCAEAYLSQEYNMEQRKDSKNNVHSLRNGLCFEKKIFFNAVGDCANKKNWHHFHIINAVA